MQKAQPENKEIRRNPKHVKEAIITNFTKLIVDLENLHCAISCIPTDYRKRCNYLDTISALRFNVITLKNRFESETIRLYSAETALIKS